MSSTPSDAISSIEEELFMQGFRLVDKQKLRRGIGAKYENREGRMIQVACERPRGRTASTDSVEIKTRLPSGRIVSSTEDAWIMKQIRDKQEEWTGDIEAVLDNAMERVSSHPGVKDSEMSFDQWENQWKMSFRKEPNTRINIGVQKLSSFGKSYNLNAEVFLESDPRQGKEWKRYALQYPELETAILRVASLDPTDHEPFADRKANDLSEPQHELLMLVFDDIQGDDPENHTYSSRLPKRVDPRTLDVLEDKGYLVHSPDDFICPEEVNYPAPKKIEMTPKGKRYCREVKAARTAGCGGNCPCGDECPCGGDCDCK